MHLWTEYEGRTIAEHYTLGKLLRSEGRNGFFATADQDGHPAVIRLTEAHFDEAEQLQRWRHVAEVHQDNLIEIEQVGQTTFEGVALTYALMEPDDANLGDVLKERPLTTAETMQVAKAVLAAVKALHESNLVHEHIEPVNVLAVGETVKLRSDCVRECIPDGEFNTADSCAELRRRDLHDFGTLLLRCLTLETEWAPAHNNLPDPFQRVIPKALDGSWSLEQLGKALDPTMFRAPAKAAPMTPVAPTAASAASHAPAQASLPLDPAPAVAATTGPAPMTDASRPAVGPTRPLVPPGVLTGTAAAAGVETPRVPLRADRTPEAPINTRSRYTEEDTEPKASTSPIVWVVGLVALVVIVILGWRFLSGSGSKGAPAKVTSHSAALTNPAVSPEAPAPAAVASRPAAEAQATATAHGAPGWYVVAFTYNHEAQAATKVQRLRRTHNSLHPQVFSPSGHAPYFVSLGGAMSEGEANQVLRHARRSGLPRDTFVRHY